MNKHPLVKEILFTDSQINEAAKKIAGEIDDYYDQANMADQTIMMLGLLKGCVPFYATFMKHLRHELETEYMVVSSYNGGLKTSGESKILLDVEASLKGRHVLIVEDVIDSGITLEYIRNYLYNRGAEDVKIVTMIDKSCNRQKSISPDWTCFTVKDDYFLVGYGLDYQERLRNLDYVGAMDLEAIKTWKW